MGERRNVLRVRGTVGRDRVAAMSLALAAFFMLGLIGWRDCALAQGMVLPGEFGVSETGAASYSIPIAIAPGTAGLAPALALSYDSEAGNGLLGMGWQLEGLPSISRCPRTIATDGVYGGVNFDANDQFCLNGQRLILIEGTHGADQAQYRTEVEGFAKVKSRGIAGTGPAWFNVWTKSGQVMEFGNSADSRLLAPGSATVRAWAVNKVSDTKGNYFTVSYTNSASQAYPTRIDYTGNAAAGLSPYNSVRFVYQTRPDPVPAYRGGTTLQTTVRLANLQVFTDANLVSDYRFAYAQGTSTGRSQLTSATLCGADNKCLPATSFTWQEGNGALSFTRYDQPIAYFSGYGTRSKYTGDWNGDGLADVMLYDHNASNGPNKWLINNGISSGSISFTEINNVLPNLAGVGSFFIVGDWNGDGLSDLLLINKRGAPAIFMNTSLSNGALTFTRYSLPTGIFGSLYLFSYYTGDWNGDGLTDIMFCDQIVGDGSNLGSGANSWFVNNGFVNGSLSFSTFNDILPNPNPGFVNEGFFDIGDWNGDGLSDILYINGPLTYLFMNTSSVGTGLSFVRQNAPISSGGGASTTLGYAGDWNADGLADAMLYNKLTTAGPNTWFTSKGLVNGAVSFARLNNIISYKDPPVDDNSYFNFGDWNGDGLSDALYFDVGNHLFVNNKTTADLVARVENGLRASVSITYKPLTAAGVYTKDSGANAAVAPMVDIVGPRWVVTHVDQSDGLGGQRGFDYAYVGAKVDQQGRGFLGFRQRKVTDLRTGIITTSSYHQNYPYAGLLAGETSVQGQLTLSTVSNSYNAVPLGGTRSRVFLNQSSATRTDLDGTAVPSVTTTYQYDAYGNATQVTATASDGYSKTTTSTYSNDTANWLLGRLLTATVTSQAP